MQLQAADRAAVESLLAFWAEAGVDVAYEDAAIDRTLAIAPPAARAVAKAVESVAPRPDLGAAVAEARRLAAGADTLEALAAAVAGCGLCPLANLGAKGAVFGRGDPQADLLIIGDAPGAEEDARAEAFVGPAALLLERMLAAASIERTYLAHSVFWRPPGNRSPTREEQAVCLPFLERALSLIRPKAALLLGKAATDSVLGPADGGPSARGQWREWRLNEGAVSAPAMPTLHPAFLLRTPIAKREAWADLLEVAARLEAEGSRV